MNCCVRFGGTWTRTRSREQSTSPSPDYAGKSKWTTTIQHSSAPCMVTDTVSAACRTKRDHVGDETRKRRDHRSPFYGVNQPFGRSTRTIDVNDLLRPMRFTFTCCRVAQVCRILSEAGENKRRGWAKRSRNLRLATRC